MIIPKQEAVRFATDLLASTLPTAPAEEYVITEPSSVASALYLPTPSSPECLTTPPSSGKASALLESTTAPPSNPITGLVSTGMIQLIFFHIYFSYTPFMKLDVLLFLLMVQIVAFTHRCTQLARQNRRNK